MGQGLAAAEALSVLKMVTIEWRRILASHHGILCGEVIVKQDGETVAVEEGSRL